MSHTAPRLLWFLLLLVGLQALYSAFLEALLKGKLRHIMHFEFILSKVDRTGQHQAGSG